MVYLSEEIKEYIFSFLGGEKYSLDVSNPETSKRVVKQKNKKLKLMMIEDICNLLTEQTKNEFLRLNSSLNNLHPNAVIPVIQTKTLQINFPDFKHRGGVCRLIKNNFIFGCEIDGIIGDTKFLGSAVYYIAFEKCRINLFYLLSQDAQNERMLNNSSHIRDKIMHYLKINFKCV